MERNTSNFKLTYVGHSGFCLQHNDIALIFDFYTDEANRIPDIIKDSGRVLVFVSHFHKDHFNPEIFDWLKVNPNISYILSSDVIKHNRFMKFPDSVTVIRPGESLVIDGVM
ncbi:MAG: MBL fold metallo-hydrolase, partial [Muribaculaceae bacterium]|nr:MBL fold metallo-hydrolase [Muribaculaceae bacterium]